MIATLLECTLAIAIAWYLSYLFGSNGDNEE